MRVEADAKATPSMSVLFAGDRRSDSRRGPDRAAQVAEVARWLMHHWHRHGKALLLDRGMEGILDS